MNSEWSIDIFTKNLKKYMEQSGKNQKEMAAIIGVSAPTFHDWLKGNKMPRMANVQKLADHFGINLSDLIEEKMTEEKEKDNKTIAGIIVRMRNDAEFLSVVKILYSLDADKFTGVKQMLNAFSK